MAKPNKRYMPVKEARALDIGKELNKSLEERKTLLHKLAGIASNIHYRMEKAGVSSLSKSMLERSLIQIAGKVTFAVPEEGTSHRVSKELVKREDGTVYYKYNYTGASINKLINDRINIMYNFIKAEGSSIKGARSELKKAQDKFHNESLDYGDLKRLWKLYEEHREEIEAIVNGSPIYQTLIGYGVASGLDDDTIDDLIRRELDKDRPSKIDNEAEMEVDW